MKVLGIETSCDETAAAVVEDGRCLLSNVIHSQIDIHKEYGGVVPEVAARSHLEVITPVITQALKQAGCTWDDIDAISVTNAPGLIGSLLVGTLTARMLAITHQKPLVPVHHVEAHVYANFITEQAVAFSPPDFSKTASRRVSLAYAAGETRAADALENSVASGSADSMSALPVASEPSLAVSEHLQPKSDQAPGPWSDMARSRSETAGDERTATQNEAALKTSDDERTNTLALPSKQPDFPMLTLIVSGGHSQLVLFHDHGKYELIGQTQDDAVGEAFDKVAKILGLPYPGGPSIATAAQDGDPTKYSLPKAKLQNPFDFSFSGLKTAVLRAVQREVGKDFTFPSHELSELLTATQRNDFAASFQQIAVETLVDKAEAATLAYQPASVVIAGGVAANRELRRNLTERLTFPIEYAPSHLCTDNAAMVAALGHFHMKKGRSTSPYHLQTIPSLSMTETAWA